MIDTREYETKEALLEAMQFEHDCSLLPVIRSEIFKTEMKIERLKEHLKILYKDKQNVENSINNFFEHNRDKTIINSSYKEYV